LFARRPLLLVAAGQQSIDERALHTARESDRHRREGLEQWPWCQDLTVLDLAPDALDRARSRLITAGLLMGTATVRWDAADVLTWRRARRYRLWHDRAVFHFLTDPTDRVTYRDLAASAVEPGGFLMVATFALDGPTHCSGLPVARYGPAELAATFAPTSPPTWPTTSSTTRPGGPSSTSPGWSCNASRDAA
jgi:hypothetical protein